MRHYVVRGACGSHVATEEIAHCRPLQLCAACLRAQETPGRRSGRRWLTRKTQRLRTRTVVVSRYARSCAVHCVWRALLRQTLRCAWCVWQSRGLTCLVLLRDGGNCLLLWDSCVCFPARALFTHGTLHCLGMTLSDDFSSSCVVRTPSLLLAGVSCHDKKNPPFLGPVARAHGRAAFARRLLPHAPDCILNPRGSGAG